MNNIMIDIETLGNKSFSVILSIAAVKFNLYGEIEDDFYTTISLQDSLNKGFKINADTLKWWLEQSSNTFKAQLKGESSATQALIFLNEIIDRESIIWGNSARFDLGLLENAYQLCEVVQPWTYRNERCVRTIASLRPDIVEKVKSEWKGEKHNPINDCLFQIEYLTRILAEYDTTTNITTN